jgi:hypothetical protein
MPFNFRSGRARGLKDGDIDPQTCCGRSDAGFGYDVALENVFDVGCEERVTDVGGPVHETTEAETDGVCADLERERERERDK